MASVCGYCRKPLVAPGLSGRSLAAAPPPHYCCIGCYTQGEASGTESETQGSIRLPLGLFLAAQSMALGLSINISEPEASVKIVVQSILLALSLVVMVWLGRPLLDAAWQSLGQRRITTESLFLAGIFGAIGASILSMVRGRGPVYFEVISVLLVVHHFGTLMTARSRERSLSATRAWSSGLQTCRKIDRINTITTVPVTSIAIGDHVEVRPGDLIAIDGRIVAGTALVRETLIGGEPLGSVRTIGDLVWSGTASEDGTLVVEATRPGSDRRVDHLLSSLTDLPATSSRLQTITDRLASRFAPFVMLVSLGTFLFWLLRVDVGNALFHAMSVLLVACPCAIGLAAPLTIWSTMRRLIARGLVSRDSGLVERLAAADCLVLDKTGTLTEDHFSLRDVLTPGLDSEARQRLFGQVAAVESSMPHPIAREIARHFRADPGVRVLESRIVPGCGIEATILDFDGAFHSLKIGREGWIAPLFATRENDPTAIAHTVLIERDRSTIAEMNLIETLRNGSREAIAQFESLGLNVSILTGDSSKRARSMGLPEMTEGASPESKREAILALQSQGRRSIFVGDGPNDSPALAASFVGVSLASGAEISRENAHATLHGGDLRNLAASIRDCRRSMTSLRITIAGAALYNTMGMLFAALGRLHPIAASLLMACSSAWVIARSTSGMDGDCDLGEQEELPAAIGGRPLAIRSVIHGLSIAVQGFILARIAGFGLPETISITLATTLVSFFTAKRWRSSSDLPHVADMTFGMLSFANLGMLLGWWSDLGYLPASGANCGCGLDVRNLIEHPGMSVGMLVFGSIAMLGLGRRQWPIAPLPFLLGNVGMLVGMAVGGELARSMTLGPPALAVPRMFVAMTSGMVLGMLVAHSVPVARHAVRIERESSDDERAAPPDGPSSSFSSEDHADEDLRQGGPRPARRGRGAVGHEAVLAEPPLDRPA